MLQCLSKRHFDTIKHIFNDPLRRHTIQRLSHIIYSAAPLHASLSLRRHNVDAMRIYLPYGQTDQTGSHKVQTVEWC